MGALVAVQHSWSTAPPPVDHMVNMGMPTAEFFPERLKARMDSPAPNALRKEFRAAPGGRVAESSRLSGSPGKVPGAEFTRRRCDTSFKRWGTGLPVRP